MGSGPRRRFLLRFGRSPREGSRPVGLCGWTLAGLSLFLPAARQTFARRGALVPRMVGRSPLLAGGRRRMAAPPALPQFSAG
eukprot:2916860-Alexandrium_andersonii.AAC.1